jgi:guanosine-3',5'-bis(diphosphate) 3'-pyrophosphohydrolase
MEKITLTKIERAMLFAIRAHQGQKRDGGGDYVQHPKKVAQLIELVGGDEDLICAAWLHDTIEDTDATESELVDQFGSKVANLVLEVTHNEQKQFLNLHSREGAMLKFADRLSNLSEMHVWDEQKQQDYFDKSNFWKN